MGWGGRGGGGGQYKSEGRVRGCGGKDRGWACMQDCVMALQIMARTRSQSSAKQGQNVTITWSIFVKNTIYIWTDGTIHRQEAYLQRVIYQTHLDKGVRLLSVPFEFGQQQYIGDHKIEQRACHHAVHNNACSMGDPACNVTVCKVETQLFRSSANLKDGKSDSLFHICHLCFSCSTRIYTSR